MEKKGVIFNYIISGLICQVLVFGMVFVATSNVHADEQESAEISSEKLLLISKNCESIRNNLKKVQQSDARARVYLGAYYETILTKYITALNVRLVENNLSNTDLIENQNKYAKARLNFSDDFISYQKALEELILVDCKNEPKKFYENLEVVRKKRVTMTQDVAKMSSLVGEHRKLVRALMEKI